MDIDDASETLAVEEGGGGVSVADQIPQCSEAVDDHSPVISPMCVVDGAAGDPPSPVVDSQIKPDVASLEEESNPLPDPTEAPTTRMLLLTNGPTELLDEDPSPDGDDDGVSYFGNHDYEYDPYDSYPHPHLCPYPDSYAYPGMHHGRRFGDQFNQYHEHHRYRRNHRFPSNRRWFQRNPEFEPPRCFIQPPPTGVGAGLENLGLTCFVNAVLQCYTHTVPLVKSIQSWDHANPCDRACDSFCILCVLRKHIERSLSRSGRTIAPHSFVNNLSQISCYFQRGQQEDAHEFHQAMLDKLERCSLDPNPGENSNSVSKSNNIVDQVFGGRTVSKLRCCNCDHCSYTHETMIDLSLEIEHVDNLSAALESFTNVEKMEDSDCKFKCEKCDEEVSVEKQLLVEQEPTVAAFHLKRFKSDGLRVDKIDKHVSFPLELDLRPFTSGNGIDEADLKYQLYAIVVHIGRSPTWGHYFSFVRSSPGIWHKFDDEKVTKVEEEFVLSQDTYILFYAKEGTPWFSSLMEGRNNTESDPSVGTSPKSVLDKVEAPYGPSFPSTSTKVDIESDDAPLQTPAPSSPKSIKVEEMTDEDGGQGESLISSTGHDVSNKQKEEEEEDGLELDDIHSSPPMSLSPPSPPDTLHGNNEPSEPTTKVSMRKCRRSISKRHLRRIKKSAGIEALKCIRRMPKAQARPFLTWILVRSRPMAMKRKGKSRLGKVRF